MNQRQGPTVYYALGEGLGHVTRTLAFARQVARRVAGRHVILASTSFRDTATALVATEPALELRLLPPHLNPNNTRLLIPQWLAELSPNRLVVDNFPRGLVGDLADWLGSANAPPVQRRVLLSRRLPSEYVDSHQLVDFVASRFGQVLVAGESSPFSHLAQAEMRPLFLLRDHIELPSSHTSATLLNVPPDRGEILVAASGRLEECRQWLHWSETLRAAWPGDLPPLRVAVPREAAGFASPSITDVLASHLPLLECLPATRLVVGAAGYNLTAETHTLGIPALQWPAKRLYDDQYSRVQRETFDPQVDLVIARIRERMLHGPPRIPRYHNGAAADGLTMIDA